jgi:serine/threonine protein kinase
MQTFVCDHAAEVELVIRDGGVGRVASGFLALSTLHGRKSGDISIQLLPRGALHLAFAAELTAAGVISRLSHHSTTIESQCPVRDPAEDYELCEKLGKGAFGSVHRVKQRSTGRQFALKVLEKQHLEGDRRRLFQIEVAIHRRLRHPNIVRFEEIFQDNQRFYIVLEYLRGGDLFDEIVKRTTFAECDASFIMGQLFSALEYLHDRGVVHRDIKPENILLESSAPNSIVKLADFGLSFSNEFPSMPRKICGTPHYMAPEMVSQQPYSTPIDMWSCGVVMFILLSGYPPFQHEERQVMYERIRRATFEFHSPYWDDVSDSARDLVRRLLDPDERQRATARECILHPWIMQTEMLGKQHRAAAHDHLKKFNARRKLRGAFMAVKWVALTSGKRQSMADLGATGSAALAGADSNVDALTAMTAAEVASAKPSLAPSAMSSANEAATLASLRAQTPDTDRRQRLQSLLHGVYMALLFAASVATAIIAARWIPSAVRECEFRASSSALDTVRCAYSSYFSACLETPAATWVWVSALALQSTICQFFVLERGREYYESLQGALQSALAHSCGAAVMWPMSLAFPQFFTAVPQRPRLRPCRDVASPSRAHAGAAILVSLGSTLCYVLAPTRLVSVDTLTQIAFVILPMVLPLVLLLLQSTFASVEDRRP